MSNTPSLTTPRWQTVALWSARLLPAIPLLVILPAFVAFFLGTPDARRRLDLEAPEVLGNAALLTLAAAFAVGPVATLTGWSWHLILGRDLGLWTFVLATLDLLSAVITAPTGWLNGVAGTAFLSAGTAAVLLMAPLAVTSNRISMRLLGRQWKLLHRLVYGVVAMVSVHLLFLGGGEGLGSVLFLFGPSIVLRIPRVRQYVVARRRQRRGRIAMERVWQTSTASN